MDDIPCPQCGWSAIDITDGPDLPERLLLCPRCGRTENQHKRTGQSIIHPGTGTIHMFFENGGSTLMTADTKHPETWLAGTRDNLAANPAIIHAAYFAQDETGQWQQHTLLDRLHERKGDQRDGTHVEQQRGEDSA